VTGATRASPRVAGRGASHPTDSQWPGDTSDTDALALSVLRTGHLQRARKLVSCAPLSSLTLLTLRRPSLCLVTPTSARVACCEFSSCRVKKASRRSCTAYGDRSSRGGGGG
jgi:hypothetical protein